MKYKLLILLLLLLPIVYAMPAGENYEVKTIDKCYGDVKVKIRGVANSNYIDYELINCKYNGNRIWTCKCRSDTTPIIIRTDKRVKHTYDIKIEYYKSNEKTEAHKRIEEFNNLPFGDIKSSKNRTTIKPPSKYDLLGFIIIGIICLLVLSIIGYKMIKKAYASEDNEVK